MLALLCGGQGRLEQKSFTLVEHSRVEHANINLPALTEATKILSHDALAQFHQLDSETLAQNQYNQFYSVLLSLCHFDLIKDILPEYYAIAGYSVGEVAAFHLSNIWSAEQTLNATWQRAKIMSAACPLPTQLGYVIGLDLSRLEPILTKHGFVVAIKNPGQFYVVAGLAQNINALMADLKACGANRAQALNVHIASHTHYLSTAVQPFHDYILSLPALSLSDNRILISALDGMRIFSNRDGINKLADEIAKSIDWQATLAALIEQGVTQVLDLGPGNALSMMIRNHYPHIAAYSVSDFQTLSGLHHWLKSAKM